MQTGLHVLFITVLFVCGQGAEIDLRCTAEVCTDWLSKNECPPLDKDCIANGRVLSFPVECGCCDYCVAYLSEGDWCDIGQPGQPTASKVCGSGLSCQRDPTLEHATCKRKNSECHLAQDAFDARKESGTLGHLQLRPSCDDRGQYSAVRCIPGSICHCVSPTGGRIFGEKPFSSPDLVMSMRCQCSRDAWRADQIGLGDGAFFAHCLPDGSYDPLQCVDGKCACIDSEGGLSSDRRVHVAVLAENSPNCFNTSLGHESGRWARPCELRRYDQLTRYKQMRDSGVVIFPDLPSCGLDGRYERVQPRDETLFCADADGNQIEQFSVARTGALALVMNCNCARTRDTLQNAAEESGLSPELPECCPNGNFRAWQCTRGLCYCVDINGGQLFQEVAEESVEELPCYSNDPCSVSQPHEE